jgi:hypothetical protein
MIRELIKRDRETNTEGEKRDRIGRDIKTLE